MISLLQIVDNGLIIFTKENEGKFFYSYAYNRFTGTEDILCVAPFWSDAYIDKSFGEVYYQVKNTTRHAIEYIKFEGRSVNCSGSEEHFSNFYKLFELYSHFK